MHVALPCTQVLMSDQSLDVPRRSCVARCEENVSALAVKSRSAEPARFIAMRPSSACWPFCRTRQNT
jgi:hypothetical protein